VKLLERVDRTQKRNRTASIAAATFKKFSDDKSSNLATMIAFWAFFSIFPLLLVLVTVLSWVLPASDKASVLGHVANLLPLLDPKSVSGLSGSWWPVVLGGATALWSGLGVVRTVQFAFDSVWEIPYHARLGTLKQVLRSLWILATIGLGLVGTTLLSGFIISAANGVSLGVLTKVAGYALSIVLDIGLFIASFKILTTREVTVREVLPGAVFAGVVFFILQELSAYIISSHLKNAQSTYGHFATVITILWWFYLQAQVTLLGAQLNVVLEERLYPRSLVGPPQTEADRRALQAYAAERAYHPEETVEARVEPADQRDERDRAGREQADEERDRIPR
jgi:membrane protein